MPSCDSPGDRQPQPQPSGGAGRAHISLGERLENSRELFRSDLTPRIQNRHEKRFLILPGLDQDLPARFVELDRILHEIEEEQAQTLSVRQNRLEACLLYTSDAADE